MNSQSSTKDEIIENLVDALNLFIEICSLEEARLFVDEFFSDIGVDQELDIESPDIESILSNEYDVDNNSLTFSEFEEVESEFDEGFDDDLSETSDIIIDDDIDDDIDLYEDLDSGISVDADNLDTVSTIESKTLIDDDSDFDEWDI